MVKRVLVTGGAGLVGSEACKAFAEAGWDVVSVDNFMRGKLLGRDGSTKPNLSRLENLGVRNHEIDFRDKETTELLSDADAVIHTAAQPSHPRSIEIPLEDFNENAWGTLFLLETLRKENPDAPFVFCSTNKVYGDRPNHYSYRKVGRRFEPEDPVLWEGFDESLSIDQSKHTPFGVSKAAADLYAQEYARLYGLKTGIFRMGCITGSAAKAVELQNWEPYFVMKALKGEKLKIFGYGGFQVRDVIHSRDLASLFLRFVKHPRPGEVYNVGGGRGNSISLLESLDLIEEITGRKLRYELAPGREADHIWWISDTGKARSHYPGWRITINVGEIFQEIARTMGTTKGGGPQREG